MVDEGHGYTVDEALTSVGFGKFQYLVFAYAGLAVFAEAMEIMILSFIGPAVKSEWGVSPSERKPTINRCFHRQPSWSLFMGSFIRQLWMKVGIFWLLFM